jgi:Tol biopolymer transport system component
MALTPGTRLGPYEIESPLGAGGMGEVYRARDTRLDRDVAIKVLPAHLSQNTELRARFEREARAISGLQHPNICVLHDIGRQDGVDFLVMEYLEGETLSARLARKPLTPDEATRIGIEIANALEKAHRGGIVHRDLKPGNVMLTKGGTKLMDFGLAKLQTFGAATPQASAPAFSAVATVATPVSPITLAGTMLGTVQYMSPEQIQGKEADPRSDIFAFGAMMYEMLTGKRAFEGKSQLSMASAILEKDPEPISAVQPLTPPALEHLVRTCLAKDPDQRFQSAHDLKLQLQWIMAGGSQVGAPAVVVSQRKNRQKLLAIGLAGGCLLALGAVLVAAMYSSRLTKSQQLVRAQIGPPAGADFSWVVGGAPVLSPDAQQVAFVAVRDGKNVIFVQRLSSLVATPLASTEDGIFPFWSPDGKYLGFFANGKLRKIEASGGPVQALCDAPEGRGGAWNEPGTIIFAPRIAGPLMRVSDGGGTPEQVTPSHQEDDQFTNRNPYFLPDGKHFLFVQRTGNAGVGGVYAGSLGGGQPQEILPVGSNVAYSNGYLFYMKDGSLMGQAFDPGGLKFKGKPLPIAESVDYYNPRDIGYFSVAQNVLLYRQAETRKRELVWLDAAGNQLEPWGEAAPFASGVLTPRNHAAVLTRANPDGHGSSLWLADTERKSITRLTPDSEFEEGGAVSVDGKSVVIVSTSGYHSKWERRSLLSSEVDDKKEFEGAYYLAGQSYDGRYIFVSVQDPKTGFDIYYADQQGDRKLVPFLNSPFNEYDARLSPDNRWLAYSSNENGSREVYVTPFPTGGAKWQVSSGGVVGLVNQDRLAMDWSPDGKSLRYFQKGKVFTVDVHVNDGKPEFSAPKEMMTVPQDVDVLSIMTDGKRMLATRPVGQGGAAPIGLVLNWEHLLQ